MSDANKAMAQEFLAAMDIGNGAAMDRCLAPDAVTKTMGFAGVSGIRGRDVMIATADSFMSIVPTGFRPTISKIGGDGDTVYLEFTGNAVLSNGEPYCNEYLFVFELENGKIKEVREYLCTALADRVILPLLAQSSPSFTAERAALAR